MRNSRRRCPRLVELATAFVPFTAPVLHGGETRAQSGTVITTVPPLPAGGAADILLRALASTAGRVRACAVEEITRSTHVGHDLHLGMREKVHVVCGDSTCVPPLRKGRSSADPGAIAREPRSKRVATIVQVIRLPIGHAQHVDGPRLGGLIPGPESGKF